MSNGLSAGGHQRLPLSPMKFAYLTSVWTIIMSNTNHTIMRVCACNRVPTSGQRSFRFNDVQFSFSHICQYLFLVVIIQWYELQQLCKKVNMLLIWCCLGCTYVLSHTKNDLLSLKFLSSKTFCFDNISSHNIYFYVCEYNIGLEVCTTFNYWV